MDLSSAEAEGIAERAELRVPGGPSSKETEAQSCGSVWGVGSGVCVFRIQHVLTCVNVVIRLWRGKLKSLK